jgi:HD-like signal output (HDOD) protein/CheY-like chemotaxis protein
MPAVLVVDDMPIFREPIEAILRAEGFEVVTATNGQEAITVLSATKPALVLLDLGMPVMDGLVVLHHMRQHKMFKATPVIILSAETDRGRIVEAVKLGISGYVLKASFSLKDLLSKVNAHFAPQIGSKAATPEAQSAQAGPVIPTHSAKTASAPSRPALVGLHNSGEPKTAADQASDIKSLKPIISRSDLFERLKGNEELKGFSPTVSQVLKLTSSPNYSLDAVSKAVRQDQAMVLKLLKVANSSVYSRGDRVDTVHKAILRIGMESIRQTVLNIGVVERFSSPSFKDHISTAQFWEHSIGCGIIAAEIAHATDAKDADTAFTSGLLHDLGRVIFAEALGDQYIQVIETARRLEAPLELVETRMLLLNHADVMDRLLNAWKFPKHLVDPIMFHHASAGSARSVAPTRVAEILRLGLSNRLAHAMLLGNSGNDAIYPIEEHCRALKISAKTIRAIKDTACQQTDDTKFALLSSTTSNNAWPRRAEQVRALLQCPFRPLYISADPEIDAYRIFCGELAGPVSGESPNIAIVHLASQKERGMLAERLVGAERDVGVKDLPLLLLSPAGQGSLDVSSIANRKCQIVSTPTTVTKFIAAIHSLLLANAVLRAA